MAARPHTQQNGSMVLWARVLFIGTTVALLLFGLLMVYSASSIVALSETGNSTYYFFKQLQFVLLGSALAVGLAFFNYRLLKGTLTWLFWGFVIALLIYTLIMGFTGLGAKRWVEIAGFNFQPGELVKISMLLISAHIVTKLHESGASMPLIAAAAVGVFFPALLILAQPDLGTALIALVGVIVIMMLGGIPKRIIAISIGVLAVLAVAGIIVASFRQSRIASFINPWASPLGDGYQVINGFYAFAEGGFTGVGLGQSHQKYLYLPEAQNDFIFAIIGEELGIIGALGTALLFALFVFAGLMIARNAPDARGRMIAGTAATLIGIQAFLNMFCVLGLAPVTGKPLPFISAGGTSMLSSLILVGLILSVAFHSDARDTATQRRDSLLILEGGLRRESSQGARVRLNNRGLPDVAAATATRRTREQEGRREREPVRGASSREALARATLMRSAPPRMAPLRANSEQASSLREVSSYGISSRAVPMRPDASLPNRAAATSQRQLPRQSRSRQGQPSGTPSRSGSAPALSLLSLSRNRTGIISKTRAPEQGSGG